VQHEQEREREAGMAGIIYWCLDLVRLLFMPPREQAYALGLIKRIRSGRHHLGSSGYWRSNIEGRSIDADGRPLPWMNYAMIEFWRERLRIDQHVFEFGSGGSSIFYSNQCASVTCVEHDPAFASYVRGLLPSNGLLIEAPDTEEAYVGALAGTGRRYDVIVIDGLHRMACARAALAALEPRGVVVVDDTEADIFEPSIGFFKSAGFRALHFVGLKPQSHAAARTSVFYRDGNAFNL
jgi:hypothetical protein